MEMKLYVKRYVDKFVCSGIVWRNFFDILKYRDINFPDKREVILTDMSDGEWKFWEEGIKNGTVEMR